MVTILSTRLTRDKRNELSCKYRHYEGFIDDVDEEEKANSEDHGICDKLNIMASIHNRKLIAALVRAPSKGFCN